MSELIPVYTRDGRRLPHIPLTELRRKIFEDGGENLPLPCPKLEMLFIPSPPLPSGDRGDVVTSAGGSVTDGLESTTTLYSEYVITLDMPSSSSLAYVYYTLPSRVSPPSSTMILTAAVKISQAPATTIPLLSAGWITSGPVTGKNRVSGIFALNVSSAGNLLVDSQDTLVNICDNNWHSVHTIHFDSTYLVAVDNRIIFYGPRSLNQACFWGLFGLQLGSHVAPGRAVTVKIGSPQLMTISGLSQPRFLSIEGRPSCYNEGRVADKRTGLIYLPVIDRQNRLKLVILDRDFSPLKTVFLQQMPATAYDDLHYSANVLVADKVYVASSGHDGIPPTYYELDKEGNILYSYSPPTVATYATILMLDEPTMIWRGPYYQVQAWSKTRGLYNLWMTGGNVQIIYFVYGALSSRSGFSTLFATYHFSDIGQRRNIYAILFKDGRWWKPTGSPLSIPASPTDDELKVLDTFSHPYAFENDLGTFLVASYFHQPGPARLYRINIEGNRLNLTLEREIFSFGKFVMGGGFSGKMGDFIPLQMISNALASESHIFSHVLEVCGRLHLIKWFNTASGGYQYVVLSGKSGILHGKSESLE